MDTGASRLKPLELAVVVPTFKDRGNVPVLLEKLAAVLRDFSYNVRLFEAGRLAGLRWQVAGVLGLAVGAVWNYGITSITTWRCSQRQIPRSSGNRVDQMQTAE